MEKNPTENIKNLGLFLGMLFSIALISYSTIRPFGDSSQTRSGRYLPAAANLAVTGTPEAGPLWWQKVESAGSLWSARDAHAVFVFKDKLWLAGGIDGTVISEGSYIPYWKAPHFNDIWYTEDGENWILALEHVAWPLRRSLSIVEFNGKLIMLGGWSPVEGYKNDVWASVDGIKWEKILWQAPWEAREGQTLSVLDGKLWLIGGVDFDRRKMFNDVWSSSNGIDWEDVTNSAAWSPRYDHAVAIFEDKLWLTGGVALGGIGSSEIWSSKDGYNWNLEDPAASWGLRHGHMVLVYRGDLWVVSGWDTEGEKGFDDAWLFDKNRQWVKSGARVPWIGREDHAGAVFRGRLWMTGGMTSGWKWSNEIWRLGQP